MNTAAVNYKSGGNDAYAGTTRQQSGRIGCYKVFTAEFVLRRSSILAIVRLVNFA